MRTSHFVDYYRVLGVDPGADPRAIRSAYRRLARRFHPDLAKDHRAPRRFLLLREAYEVLSDPEARRRYDRALAERDPRRPAGARTAPVPGGPAAEPVPPRRGFRVVLDLFGIRLEAGAGYGEPAAGRRPRRR